MEYKLVYESSNMEINFIFIFIALLAIIIIVYYIFRIEIQKKIISTIIIFFISFSIYGIYKKHNLVNLFKSLYGFITMKLLKEK